MNQLMLASVTSLVTQPLYVIAMSMQMSVMANITIYGDVKPHEVNKGLLVDRIGMSNLVNRKAINTGEKQLAKYKEGQVQVVKDPRPDLTKMSGQVGHNKPFRAPIYRTYWECVRGLHKQGILGFYKGNGLRLTYYALHMHCIA